MADLKKIKVLAVDSIVYEGKTIPAGEEFEMDEATAKDLSEPRTWGDAPIQIIKKGK